MDLAYDHIQEEALSPEKGSTNQNEEKKPETTLNTDFQEAYKAISSSPWGAKLGGFFGSVVKQVLGSLEKTESPANDYRAKRLTKKQPKNCLPLGRKRPKDLRSCDPLS